MQEYYAAPMEGLTGWRWRQVQSELFGGADRYYTPFLSPNANFEFQTKELQEIDPEHNRDLFVVPQILTNRPEYFVWAAKECQSRGYSEVNLNLGCPSGTVTAKNKGAGLLREKDILRALLDGIFNGLPNAHTAETLWEGSLKNGTATIANGAKYAYLIVGGWAGSNEDAVTQIIPVGWGTHMRLTSADKWLAYQCDSSEPNASIRILSNPYDGAITWVWGVNRYKE